jgi:hypothetical protein
MRTDDNTLPLDLPPFWEAEEFTTAESAVERLKLNYA